MNTIWVIEAESQSYSWRVYAATEYEAIKIFSKMWDDWCAKSGADIDYWGKGLEDICPAEVKIGSGYLDTSEYKLA